MPGVWAPQDSVAMDISAVNSHSSSNSPRPETKFPFEFYRELCQSRRACWRCQKLYDEAHRSNKATGKPFCANPQVTAADMDAYCVTHTSSPAGSSSARIVASTTSVPVVPLPGVPFHAPPLLSSHPFASTPAMLVYSSSYSTPYHYRPHMPPAVLAAPYVPGTATTLLYLILLLYLLLYLLPPLRRSMFLPFSLNTTHWMNLVIKIYHLPPSLSRRPPLLLIQSRLSRSQVLVPQTPGSFSVSCLSWESGFYMLELLLTPGRQGISLIPAFPPLTTFLSICVRYLLPVLPLMVLLVWGD